MNIHQTRLALSKPKGELTLRTCSAHALRPKRGKRHANQSEISRDIPDPDRCHRSHQIRRYILGPVNSGEDGFSNSGGGRQWSVHLMVYMCYDDVNSIIIGGDFNTDLSRINSLHTGALTNFVNQNGYVFGLNCSNVGVEFTYENIATGSRSVIDHIIVSESLSSQVLSYYSIDSVDNMSDHRVLVAELNFDVERMPKTARKYERKASWRSASSIDLLAYKQTLCTLLEGICVPQSALACHNLSCAEHTEQIDKYYNDIINGVEAATSDILIHACPELYIHLCALFNVMLCHGVCPSNMCISTLIPIPKCKKKSLNDSNNYRAIALGSVVAKVIDNIILVKYKDILISDELQFGFKKGHSTVHCSFVLNEVMDYYSSRNSPTLLLFLDASRAFDRVQYVKLFNLLLKRGLCPMVARFLAYMYTKQVLRVNWNGCISDVFNTSNGVKQGGILSPILFCIYIDELFRLLKLSGYGCYIGDMFYGALGYADDVCLLAPSRTALSAMIHICESYGREYDVKFNTQKTHLVVCDYLNKYINMSSLTLNGETIIRQRIASHLGHVVGVDSHNITIRHAVNDLTWRTNYMLSKFASCNSQVKTRLFRTFCTNYYGCVLWRINSNVVHKFYATWRNCVRKVWKVPWRTHCDLVKYLYGGLGIKGELLSRYLMFYGSVCNSTNRHTALCAELCELSNTPAASNRRLLMAQLNINRLCFQDSTCKMYKHKLMDTFKYNQLAVNVGNVIRELCLVRDNELACELSPIEVNAIINELCIN